MPKNKILTPQEEQNLEDQLQITSREAEIRENTITFPGAPPGLADDFMKSIMDFEDRWAAQTSTTIGDHLQAHKFLDADKLTEEEAEDAISDLLTTLAKNNILIDTPEMVSAKEFYRWLCADFVRKEVVTPLGNGWRTNFIYTELVPEGPDAMNFTVTTCLEDLFRLGGRLNLWTFEDHLITKEEGDGPTEVQPALTRYITAWREAIHTVAEYLYTPVTGVRISEELADFSFEVAYALIRENGSRDEFSGTGTARLIYDGCYWSIRNIRFPGFEIPTPSLS